MIVDPYYWEPWDPQHISEGLFAVDNVLSLFLHVYCMIVDRYYWEPWDPQHISEGLFAVGNVLSFARLSYLLAANEHLGPMQISLAKMLKVKLL